MKKNNLILICLFIACTMLVSFRPISTIKNEKSAVPIKSITLVSTMIGRMLQPIIPLLDAAPFNKKTNSIASLIVEQEMKSIESFREAVASNLKTQFNCDVIYGNALTSKPEYKELIKKYDFPTNLIIDNPNFTKIIINNDEKNLFQIEDGNVFKYMRNVDQFKNNIAEMCTSLKTDYLAVSYSNLAVVQFGMFGGHGKIVLQTAIYLFDKDGNMVAKGSKDSKPLRVVGDDIMDYKTQLNSLSEILPPMMEKVSKKLNDK
jgi:hypothetical protein